MLLVAAGQSNDEIADRLVLSPATVKSHVSRIMAKVDARDRAQLVVLAYESGMVNPAGCDPGGNRPGRPATGGVARMPTPGRCAAASRARTLRP